MSDGKTVFVLGAGASKASDFALPVMKGFFDSRLDKFGRLSTFLRAFYPDQAVSEWNVEDILAFLCMSRSRMSLWGMTPRAGEDTSYDQLYTLTLKYIAERLQITRSEACSIHTRLFSQLDPQDTILTLDYDLVVDQVLFSIEPRQYNLPRSDTRIWKSGRLITEGSVFGAGGEPPSLTPAEEKTGFYLKLHGSLDWLRCPTPGCRNHVNIYSPMFYNINDGQEAGRPCRFCGAALEIMIVPPIVAKRLEDRGRIAFLWHTALRELRRARTVVFVGVSLAPTDFELQWLLREGLGFATADPAEIEVVNPNSDHRSRLRSVIPCCSRSFNEYDSLEDFFARHKL